MKKLILGILALFMVALTLSAAFAQEEVCVDCCDGPCDGEDANSSTLDIDECLVRVNDRRVSNDVTVLKAFDRGEELEIKVEFVSHQDAENVQIMAWLTGYHRSSDTVFDITPTFDVEANVAYEEELNLELPDDFDLESGDELKLRIEISDKFSSSYIREYNLKIEALRHNVVIQDIILDPSSRVEAGRGLFASVRVKNMGERDEDSIKVTAEIPALDLKATEYIDELENDEATTSEDMFLRIPSNTEAGEYVVKVTVEYADGDEEVTKQTTIEITEGEGAETPDEEDRTVVTVPGRQDVIKGTAGTVYPIILENRGATDRSYTLSASGLDSWATYRFDPGSFVLIDGGETKTVYLYVTPKEDAPVGEKVFMVNVETQGDQKQVALTANVLEGDSESPFGDWASIRRGLEIGLVVLVVLLVILILIIGFNKLKGQEEPEEVSGQTYY